MWHTETTWLGYTIVVESTKQDTLLPVTKQKVMPDSIAYTDCCKSCDVPDVSEFTHHCINHSTHFTDCQNLINDIENFWNQAKRVLRKYNGIECKSFPLFLKKQKHRFYTVFITI
ncbi:transposase [Neisseria weixii]|uniref:Transposase n=1 Tax=Neisseria weixii TaxID=1853276 RepID=A0A3N4MKD1_9NEIS|nr:hypothetical protein CGZ65_06015 [Neisseria weixii]RPD84162.1 transposase [Neisseria weixii]RPD85601.1 transposase [Neisseria weixii]